MWMGKSQQSARSAQRKDRTMDNQNQRVTEQALPKPWREAFRDTYPNYPMSQISASDMLTWAEKEIADLRAALTRQAAPEASTGAQSDEQEMAAAAYRRRLTSGPGPGEPSYFNGWHDRAALPLMLAAGPAPAAQQAEAAVDLRYLHQHAKIAGDYLVKAKGMLGGQWNGAMDEALNHVDYVRVALEPDVAPPAATTASASEIAEHAAWPGLRLREPAPSKEAAPVVVNGQIARRESIADNHDAMIILTQSYPREAVIRVVDAHTERNVAAALAQQGAAQASASTDAVAIRWPGRRKGKWEVADLNDTVPAHVLADPELEYLCRAPAPNKEAAPLPNFSISRFSDTKQRGVLVLFDRRLSDTELEAVRAALAQQGAAQAKSVCRNCADFGWEPSISGERRPCEFCKPGAAQAAHAGATDAQDSFEAWAKSHGGLPLDRAGDHLKTDDDLLHFPTYKFGRTEIAWRAWANSRAAIAANQPQKGSEA
jgi:hypothetical protein